jgi:hypothetical protein
MAKINLVTINNLNNQSTVVNAINNNSTKVAVALENTLSRDGTTPNQMNADLDMNSKQILNLSAPITLNSPVRAVDLQTAINGIVSPGGGGGGGGGTGDVSSNTPFSVDGELPLFQGATGKQIRRGSGTGAVLLNNGVVSVAPGSGDQVLTPSGFANFLPPANGVERSYKNKLQDQITIKDYGAIGDGSDATSAISLSLSTNGAARIPKGIYNTTGTTMPQGSAFIFDPGATLTGTVDYTNGGSVKFNYNPSNISWTNNVGTHRSMIYADIGGYPNSSFGTLGLVFPVLGTVRIPSTSTGSSHAAGVAGLADTFSTSMGAVGIYGQADLRVANSAIFGFNTVSQDNGFIATQVWGGEIDCNISNAATNVVGLDLTGGSTVSPGLAIAYRVGALGAFSTPKKKWTSGFSTSNGAAGIAFEIGVLEETGINKDSQAIKMYSFDSAGTRQQANIYIQGANQILSIDAPRGTAFSSANGTFKPFATNDNTISFFNTGRYGTLVNVTGSKGGNAALDSLLINLHNMGLITNAST